MHQCLQSFPSAYQLDQDHLWIGFKAYSRYLCLSSRMTDTGNTYHSELQNLYTFSFTILLSLFYAWGLWTLSYEVLCINSSLRQVTVKILVHSHWVLKQEALPTVHTAVHLKSVFWEAWAHHLHLPSSLCFLGSWQFNPYKDKTDFQNRLCVQEGEAFQRWKLTLFSKLIMSTYLIFLMHILWCVG